jgi:hypothetical protein
MNGAEHSTAFIADDIRVDPQHIAMNILTAIHRLAESGVPRQDPARQARRETPPRRRLPHPHHQEHPETLRNPHGPQSRGRLPLSTAFRTWAKLKAATQNRQLTMTTKDHLARHDSQIAHLEQVMTALAEAQVKTEEAQERLTLAMAALAKSHAETEATTRALIRQWQAYLNTLCKN